MRINISNFLVFIFLVFLYSFGINAQTRTDISKAKAIHLMDQGNYKEALDILEGLKGRAEDKDIYFLLGIAYQKTGKYENSVSSFKSFDEKSPRLNLQISGWKNPPTTPGIYIFLKMTTRMPFLIL
ncbi:MAG: hypothetical protein NTY22_02880 [Proteobacteria bacterium]|nr:hypothetical protein [Pseudomonadota bacterium]